MYKKQFGIFLIICLLGSHGGLDTYPRGYAQESVSSEVLGEIHCVVNREPKILVLTKEIIDPKQKKTLYQRLVIFKLKLYSIKDGKADKQVERTVWQDYSFYVPQAMPSPRWNSALIADEATGTRIYLVLAISMSTRLLSTVYAINPLNSSEAVIAEFDEKGRLLDVPKENREKPLAEYKKDFPLEECGVNRLRLEMEPDNLVIYPERDKEKCYTVHFRLDLKTKEWSEIVSQQLPK